VRYLAVFLLSFGLLAFFVVPVAGSFMLGLGALLVFMTGGNDDDD